MEQENEVLMEEKTDNEVLAYIILTEMYKFNPLSEEFARLMPIYEKVVKFVNEDARIKLEKARLEFEKERQAQNLEIDKERAEFEKEKQAQNLEMEKEKAARIEEQEKARAKQQKISAGIDFGKIALHGGLTMGAILLTAFVETVCGKVIPPRPWSFIGGLKPKI